MGRDRLVEIGRALFGERGWQTKMSSALDVDVSTIRRWMALDRVPRVAEIALESMMMKSQETE